MLLPGAVLAAAPVCATPMIKGAHGHHRPVVPSTAPGRAGQLMRSDDAAQGNGSPAGSRRPLSETQVLVELHTRGVCHALPDGRSLQKQGHSDLLPQCHASVMLQCSNALKAVAKPKVRCAVHCDAVFRLLSAGANDAGQIASGAGQDADAAAHGGH